MHIECSSTLTILKPNICFPYVIRFFVHTAKLWWIIFEFEKKCFHSHRQNYDLCRNNSWSSSYVKSNCNHILQYQTTILERCIRLLLISILFFQRKTISFWYFQLNCAEKHFSCIIMFCLDRWYTYIDIHFYFIFSINCDHERLFLSPKLFMQAGNYLAMQIESCPQTWGRGQAGWRSQWLWWTGAEQIDNILTHLSIDSQLLNFIFVTVRTLT
jgi:hypothetical protein